MASTHISTLSPISSFCFNYSMSLPSLRFTPTPLTSLPHQQPQLRTSFRRFRFCRAMVQQVALGAPAIYAKEMERISAKESLLLALKDSGGFEALVTGKPTDMQKIDVNERIIGLERLNPTPRPTRSFPATVAGLQKMDVLIKDGYAKITANTKLLNLIENEIILSAKLTVEGPLRIKGEYDEVVLESPRVDEGFIPDQLKGAFSQAVSTLQQLPLSLRDAVSSGLTIPLNGSFQRMFMISYLDEEILIVRDTSGVPEVLMRNEGLSLPIAEPESTEI